MTIYDEIAAERKHQDQKWGVQNHHPLKWLAIAGEEHGEACKGALESSLMGDNYLRYRRELIQLAAVCVAAIESLDRGRGQRSE